MNIWRRLFGSRRSDPASQEPSPLLTTPPVEQPLLPVITTTGGQEEPDPEVLRKTLFAFMQATLPEKRAMLHRTSLLLTPAAVTMLNEMAQAAQDQQTNLAQVMKFLADLLERVRQEGIDPVFDEGEHVLRSEVSVNLYLQWLSTPTYRDARRFLQQHPEILNDTSETGLQTALELVTQAQMNDPQQQQEQVEAVRLLLYLFRDIRARVVRLQGLGQFSDDDSLTRQAILEGYVNWKGGFMLDLPAWLEKTSQKSLALRRSKKQLHETASSRAALWQKALKRAQHEGLAAEIIAWMALWLWDALDDIIANQSSAQEEGLQYLNLCLSVYTEERYPYQWALVQTRLGSAYNKRIRGDKANNLEQAIACYTAALRVYTEDTFSVDWAKTQNRLALIYNERILGDKADNLEQAIACYTAALRVYTEDTFPTDWADIQSNLSATYFGRIKGDKAENLEQAITCCSAALRVYTEEAHPFEWAAVQTSLGDAFRERIRKDMAENLEQAINNFSAALRVITEETYPFEWAIVQNALGATYLKRIRGNTADNLEEAITCFTAALRVVTEEAFPSDWASTQNNLGNVYWNRIKGDKAENVEQAIACSSAALRVQTEDALPVDWANTQIGLGNAYWNRIKGDKADNIEWAIACSSAALRVYTEDTLPSEWAKAQNNLGAAYMERIRGDKANNLERAIACFTAALRVYTEEAFPFEWAKAQLNLSVVYNGRIKGDKAENLEQAIACCSAALRVYTEKAFPFLWASTQNSLGIAYFNRIKGDRADNLEQAIAYLTAALRVYTEEAFPFEWTITQNALGLVYHYRMKGDTEENLEQAIACCTAALRVYTENAWPFRWAMVQNNLGTAYIERLRGNKDENLEQAIAYLTATLHVYTEEAFPFEWVRTLNNLGMVYYNRIRGDKDENLEQAIAYLTATLHVYTEEAFPFEWARTQHNLGGVYYDRIQGNKAENVEQAIACFTAALRVYTEEALPLNHRLTALNLAGTLSFRERWDEVHSIYLSALRVETTLYALASGAKGQDAILVEGQGGADCDAYALVRLGRLGEAVVTLERGRARGLAAARALNAADPQLITDPARRADYLAKRSTLRQSLAAVQQPEEGFLLPEDVSSAQRDETPRLRAEQDASHLERSQQLIQAQAAFNAAVEAIRAAGDPADFLRENVTEASLLAATQRGSSGHAIVSLVATPWGGMALGAFSAHPDRHTTDRFAALDLPALTSDAVTKLVGHPLDSAWSKILGGFVFTSEGRIFNILQDDWADRQRPSWDGTTPLQEWDRQDAPRRQQALDTATFKDMAGWLHEVCQQEGIDSTLDAVCQDVLHQTRFHFIVAKPWNSLRNKQRTRLRGAVRQAFLLLEIEHALTALSDWVMRPLAAWLHEEKVRTVTIIPGGYLAAFPILACDVGNGETFADVFHASVAPSMRSLVPDEHPRHPRSGVATLGNPFSTRQSLQPLHYGQAEALTLAHLGGDPQRCRIQGEATKAWLLQCLRDAQVVDASCHGVAMRDYLQSALYLADETLSLGDALNQQVADLAGLRLLILSACQTAIPDVRGAENEVRSLAVGMLQAGAEAVIASLWSVRDQATYLLIVRFAQEWFPNMRSEPPAAALARAQHWLRNVTWEDLTHWQASESLPSIIATMPDYRPEDQQDAVLAGVGPIGTVRGDEDFLVAHEDWLFDDDAQTPDDRSPLGEWQENIRTFAVGKAKKDPHFRPYAHPFYWAGFQVTGW